MDTSFTKPLPRVPFLKNRWLAHRPAYNVSVLGSIQGCFMDDRLQDHRASSPSAAPTARRKHPTEQQLPAHTASGRRHMGVATNDPDYLTPINTNRQEYTPVQPAHPRSQNPKTQNLHAGRYIETPTSRKSIFIRRRQARRRIHLILATVAIVAVVSFLIWSVFLR